MLAELEQTSGAWPTSSARSRGWTAQVRRVQGEITALRGEISRLQGQRAGQELALAAALRVMYKVHAQGGGAARSC